MVPIVLLRGLLRESGHWHYFIKAIKQRYPDIEILTPNVPGNGDLNGKASHELSISCTICSVLPQEMIYIY